VTLIGLLVTCVTGVATAGLAWHAGRAQRDEAERNQLAAAVGRFLAALDDLAAEAVRVPAESRLMSRADQALRRRAPRFVYFADNLGRATVLRQFHALERRFREEANQLLLLAPNPLLSVVLAALELLGDFEAGSNTWRQRWQEQRNQLQIAARAALNSDGG
jgi:hypothetical protein